MKKCAKVCDIMQNNEEWSKKKYKSIWKLFTIYKGAELYSKVEIKTKKSV